MKYVFTFSEINYGRIEIEADRQPDNDEIIEQILEGKADYRDTDFTDFKLIETERTKPKKERSYERWRFFLFSDGELLKVELSEMHYTGKHRLLSPKGNLLGEKSPNTPCKTRYERSRIMQKRNIEIKLRLDKKEAESLNLWP